MGICPSQSTFHPDLTFLTGLNGSGKTTALRLLMGLLGPDLTELGSVLFRNVAVTIVHEKQEIVITSSRTTDGLLLTTSQVNAELAISAAEVELLLDSHHRDEPRRPGILEKLSENPAYQAIAKISTPMFLGLDRRFTVASDSWVDPLMTRRLELEMRSLTPSAGPFLVAWGFVARNRLDGVAWPTRLAQAATHEPSLHGSSPPRRCRRSLSRWLLRDQSGPAGDGCFQAGRA
jgi:hypothetical protein